MSVAPRLLFGLLLALLAPASVAHADRDRDSGLWTAVIGQGSAQALGPDLERWRWWLEGQLRYRDGGGEFDQGFVRGAFGYTVAPRTSVWLGYAWFRTSPETGSNFDESRIWQQLSWTTSLDSVAIATRTRLEQRLVETGGGTGWRFRQWMKLSYPLADRLDLVGWDEVFLNLNSTGWGADNGFDQNRLFAGLGLTLDRDRHVSLEVGYLQQFVNDRGSPDQLNHLFSISLLLNY